MDVDRITYEQLGAVLVHLGFSRSHVEPKWVRYEHAPSGTEIVLVEKPPHEIVRITDAVSARLHLIEKGLITEEEMEAIVSGQKAVVATDN